MGGILDAELFGTAIRQATPLILASLGGLLSERVGVVNIGLEGKILMGAFAAALGTLLSGSLWVGLAAAVLVGLALALIHAVATQEWRTDCTAHDASNAPVGRAGRTGRRNRSVRRAAPLLRGLPRRVRV